jgi:serine phosphatase RsbU (regulator of sigma subunit)
MEIIRNNSKLGAEDILQAVFAAVEKFQGTGEFEDDATMAVIKVVEDV